VTLGTIPILRRFSNECLADVFFYCTGKIKDKILHYVAAQINSKIKIFRKLNHFDDNTPLPVSLLGHSLGSVIIYDLLSEQSDPSLKLDYPVDCMFLVGSPLGGFLTCRGVAPISPILIENVKMYNIFQPTDPVAYRVEPLLVPEMVSVPASHVPHYMTGG
jgi:hypothetical protein